MNGPMGLWDFRNYCNIINGLGHIWAIFQQSPTRSQRHTVICLWFQNTVLYTGTAVETVKLNFHLELYATLDCNLYSELCLELQVYCNLASHEALTDTGLPWDFPAGGAYASYSMAFHEFIREHPTLIDCDV